MMLLLSFSEFKADLKDRFFYNCSLPTDSLTQEPDLPQLLPVALILAGACVIGVNIIELWDIRSLKPADGLLGIGALLFGMSALFFYASRNTARCSLQMLADGFFAGGIVLMSAWVNAIFN